MILSDLICVILAKLEAENNRNMYKKRPIDKIGRLFYMRDVCTIHLKKDGDENGGQN